jgi:membrane fusion protein, multidrug efflux system
MASTTKRRRGRTVATSVLCLTLAGGAAIAIALRNPKAASTIATPSIFKTTTVATGDLTTTEQVDGIVQLSSTLAVLHRIEGQTSSTTTTAAASSASTAAGPAALSSSLRVDDCSSTTVPTTAPEPPSTPPAVDAAPDTTPIGSTPTATPDTTPVPTATTTIPVVEPVAPTEPPAQTCDTTTTTAPATANTTVLQNGGTGQAPTGGATRTGAAPSASGAAASTASTARVTQTITSIIATNTPIHQGDVLYTVDGAPVVALDGSLPAWRSLSTASDDGADVSQLETSLVALGYDPQLEVTIDNHFDSATRAMVKAWQQGLGVEETGTVALGSAVFLPSTTTVSAVNQAVGDTIGDGDTVLTLAAPTQEVVVDVPTGDEAQVVPGLGVQIGDVRGTVSRLRSADRDGAVVVEAVIAPASAIAGATNGSAVNVTLTLQNDAGVLIAPAEALVSRLDGSYAVQIETTDGTTEWLTVELLGVSGGNVALRGDGLTEGTVLLLPA